MKSSSSFVVMMPVEFTLNFDDLYLAIVEIADNLRAPLLVKELKFFRGRDFDGLVHVLIVALMPSWLNLCTWRGDLAFVFDSGRWYAGASLPPINQEGIELGADEQDEAEVIAQDKRYQSKTC